MKQHKKRILVANDDGIDAPGLRAVVSEIGRLIYDIYNPLCPAHVLSFVFL